jgi:hypothetical protein
MSQYRSRHIANLCDLSSSKFIDLLSNCAWYVYEVSDYDLCLRLVDIAGAACEDTESLQYATLCNTVGGAYYELNQLLNCRKSWETCLQIREAKLPAGNLEVRYDHIKNPSILSLSSYGLLIPDQYSFQGVITIWVTLNQQIRQWTI